MHTVKNGGRLPHGQSNGLVMPPNWFDILYAQAFLIGILMQISSIFDYIDNGHMALSEFQRGYVWGREQVRGLFQSLYRGHPVRSLLV